MGWVLISFLTIFQALAETHTPLPKGLADPMGPPDPKTVSQEVAGVTLYNAYSKAGTDPRLMEELVLKAAVLSAAKKEFPLYSNDYYRWLGDFYYDHYRYKKSISNPFDDVNAFADWGKKKLLNMGPKDFKSFKKFFDTFTFEDIFNADDEARRFLHPQKDAPSFGLLKGDASRWGSFENRVKFAKNLYQITADPELMKAYGPMLEKVNSGNAFGDHSQFMNENQTASNSYAIRAMREETKNGGIKEKQMLQLLSRELLTLYEKANLQQEKVLTLLEKEEERRKAFEEMEKYTAPAEAAALTATVLFPKSKEIRALAEITHTSCKIAKLSVLNSGSVFFFKSYSEVLLLVNGLISLFGNQKSDTELILEAINELRKQMEFFHRAMDNQFYDQRNQIEQAMTLINRQFDRLERQASGHLSDIQERINHVEKSSKRQVDYLKQLSEDQRLRDIERRQLETESLCHDLKCEYWRQSHENETPSEEAKDRRFGSGNPGFIDMWMSNMGKMYAMASVGSRSYLMAGTPIRVDGDGFQAPGQPAFYHNMNHQAWLKLTDTVPGGELATILSTARILGIPIDTGFPIEHKNNQTARGVPELTISDVLPIANERDFIIHAGHFLGAAQRWNGNTYPDLYGKYDVNLDLLSELIDIGHNTREAMKSIAPLDRLGRPSLLTVHKLANNYERELRHFQSAVEAKKDAFIHQFGIGGYDAFRPIAEMNPEPGLSISQSLFNGKIKPCEGYTPVDFEGKPISKDRLELQISSEVETKFKAMIPKDFFIAADVLGGMFSFCYRDLSPDVIKRVLSLDENHNIDDERWSEMGITIEGAFISPKIEQPLIFLKKRIRDETPLHWTRIDWDGVLQSIYAQKVSPTHPMSEVPESDKENKKVIDEAKAWYKLVLDHSKPRNTGFLGFHYAGEHVFDAPKGIQTALDAWPANIKRVASGEGIDLLPADYRADLEKQLRKYLQDHFGAKRLVFLEKHMTKDLKEQIGEIGEALQGLDGAKKVLTETMRMALGDALDTRTPEGRELFRRLALIRGGDSLAYAAAVNGQEWVMSDTKEKAFEDTMTPIQGLITELAKPKPNRSIEHQALTDTVFALENFYHQQAPTKGTKVAKPINVFDTPGRNGLNSKEIFLTNEILKAPIKGVSRVEALELAEQVKDWTVTDIENLLQVYQLLRQFHSSKEAMAIMKEGKELFYGGPKKGNPIIKDFKDRHTRLRAWKLYLSTKRAGSFNHFDGGHDDEYLHHAEFAVQKPRDMYEFPAVLRQNVKDYGDNYFEHRQRIEWRAKHPEGSKEEEEAYVTKRLKEKSERISFLKKEKEEIEELSPWIFRDLTGEAPKDLDSLLKRLEHFKKWF